MDNLGDILGYLPFLDDDDFVLASNFVRCATTGPRRIGVQDDRREMDLLTTLAKHELLTFQRLPNYYGPRNDPEKCYDAWRLSPTEKSSDGYEAMLKQIEAREASKAIARLGRYDDAPY